MVELVGKPACDPAVDFRPEMRVAAGRCRVRDEAQPLVGYVERGCRSCADDLERRPESVHQAVGPRPGIVEASDGAVLEVQHGVERILVAGAEYLALLGVDFGDLRTADPLHGI